MKNIFKALKYLNKDEKGSLLPMIAIILILTISLGAVNFALVVMYRDRAVVRNALDAGTTSSLAAVAVEKHKPIYYGERERVIEKISIICGMKEIEVPRVTEWLNTESDIKNYIQLDVSRANNVAKQYFEKNIELSNLDYNIKSWDFVVTYDEKRVYTVKKRRNVRRPHFKLGIIPPRRSCDPGIPDVYSYVSNPETWWFSDFEEATTDSWNLPSKWSSNTSENKEIIFPRWVEVKAKVVLELPVPFGSLIGRTTYNASFDVTSYKELIHAIP